MIEMNDRNKSKEQLIEELQRLRHQVIQLQKSEVRRHEWLDGIADPVLVFDQTTKLFLDCNQAALDFYGYTVDELRTMTPAQLHPPEESGQATQTVDELSTAALHTSVHATKKGHHVPVEVHTSQIEYQGQQALISVVRRIGEREEPERSIWRESEEKYRTILEDIEEGYYEADLKGNITFFNESLCQILGYPPAELAELNYRQFMDEVNAKQVFEAFNRVYETRESTLVAGWEITRKDDGKRLIEASISLISDSKGQATGFRGIVRDVTEQKHAESRYKQLLATLEHRNTLLRTAAEVSRAASSILDPEALLPQVVDLVRERFNLYYAGLFLVDQTGAWTGEPAKWAVLRAGTGKAGQEMLKQSHKLEIGGTSMVGWCIAKKQARVALDVGEEAVWFDNPLLPETRSELALPLINRGRAIGALTIQSTQETAFSNEDITALQAMADQLANAIANARLYNQAQREISERKRAEEALRKSEENFQRMVTSINDILYSVDGETGEFAYLSPSFERLLGYTMQDVRDMGGRRAFLSQVIQGDRFSKQERIFRKLRAQQATEIPPWEAWWRCKDGSLIYLEDRSFPVYKNGQLVNTDGVLRDVTERKRAEEALRQTEQRYRAVAESTVTGISILNTEGDLTFVNAAFADMLGYAADQLTGLNVSDLAASETPVSWQMRLEQMKEVLHTTFETALRHKDGNIVNVLISTSPLTAPDGSREGTMAVIIDITERKQAEQALRVAHEELAEYTENLERRTAQLQVGTEVAREAAAILDVRQLLATAVRLISKRFGFYHAGVFLIDDVGQYAVLRAASSEGGQHMLERGHKLPFGVGIVGHVAQTGQPRIALDVGEDAVHFANPDLPETRSEMGLPLKIRGHTIGVLDVQDTHEAAFSEDDIAVLQTLADQLAIAVDNARLVERTEAQLRELSLLYGERSTATWVDLVTQKRSLDYVYDRIDVLETEKAAVPALDVALTEGQTITFTEPKTSERTLATPLKLHNQIIGSLGIQETDGDQDWTPDEIALIEAVSEQVALALENAQHFAETQRSAQQMRILNELGQALTTQLDVEDVIAETYWGASRLLDTTSFYIALYDPDAEMISFPFAVEDGEQVEWPPRQIGAGLTEYVIHSKESLLIPENVGERMAELGIDMIGTPSLSWLGVPLTIGDRVLGVIAVQSYTSPNLYGEREKDLLTAIASQTAIALENARLFEETTAHAEELTVLNEMSQALVKSLNVDEVLEQAYQGASRLLQISNFSVGLYDPEKERIHFALDISESEEDKKYVFISADEGLSGHIIRTRKGLLIQENVAEELNELGLEPVGEIPQSWLGVPLLIGDKVLGVMITQSFSTPHAYDEHDWNLMRSIANQTAIALQNASLFRETEAALAETEALYLVGETISRLGPLEETFQMLADVLVGQLGYASAWLGLLDQQASRLKGIASAGISTLEENQLEYTPLSPQSRNATIQAMLKRKPLVTDAGDDAQSKHIANIPILAGSEAAGVLVVKRPGSRPKIGGRDLEVLDAVADQAAVALQNARLLDETQRRAGQLAAAAEVARDATSILDVDELLNQTVHLISEQFGFYHAGVFLVDEERGYAVLRAASSEGGQRMLAREHKLPVGKVGIVGNVAATGEPHIALDVGEDAVHFANPDLPNTRSEMGLPLTVRGQVIGVLDVQSTTEAAFSEEDVSVLQTLADQLAAAIANARLFQEARTRADELSALNELGQKLSARIDEWEILEEVYQQASRLVDASNLYIALYDATKDEVNLVIDVIDGEITRPWATWKTRHDFTEYVIRNREPVIAQDTYADWADENVGMGIHSRATLSSVGVRIPLSMLGAPLIVGDEVLGVIAIRDYDNPRAYDRHDQDLLTSIANQTATALQNVSLFEETQRRAGQLAAAAEVARDATSILDVDELLNQTVHLISEQFSFYHAGVFLVDEEREYAVLRAASSEGGQRMLAREHKLPVGKVGIVGNVAATGEPHIALDVGEDAVHFANPDLPSTRSEMGLPLTVHGQVIGVLDVQSTTEAAFSEEDVSVLQTLADQLAAAIANARLFENVRTDAKRRALINEVQQAAAASLNPQELLHRAGEVISRRLERPTAVFSWEIDRQCLRPVAIHDSHGEDVAVDEDARITRRMAPTLLSRVLDRRQTCILDPVAEHLGQPALELIERVGIESGIYIPLTARDRMLGVLAIAQTDGYFPEGLEFADTIGRNLSVALENARLYQDALETAEKLQEMDRLKSQFLANMSHELRTPLNSIIGFSRVILKGIDGPLTDMQRTDLEAVYNSGQHLLELINSILDISKIQAGKMELSFEETNLRKTIEVVISTTKALVKDKPVELQRSVPDDLPIIRADPRRIRQILTNLVGNAAKFTEEGFIRIVAKAAGSEVVIKVVDTGVGIPEDKIETIFEEFTQVDGTSTRAVGGTGLGLSITRHFVEMHGGRIWVESTVDVGSTFYVALPIAGPSKPEGEEKEEEGDKADEITSSEERRLGPESDQKVVLCVDDDEGVLMLFRRYLSKQGYHVVSLTDGTVAVEKAQELQPFAITLDVMMPEKDGWQIIQELKSNLETHDIPVIMCSIVSDKERGFSLGAAGYLVKPILENDLINALERLRQEEEKDRQQVLIVDDHLGDRKLLRRMIESQKGYEVIEASSGQEAILLVQQERPDILVLDLMMPDIDGFAVLESVKANETTRSIPVIVVTAKELSNEERSILNRGVETLLQKGLFEQQELLADIAAALERLSAASDEAV